jgi:hypothetical protein
MIGSSRLGVPGVELGPDRRFEPRVLRLTAVSSVALGVVWALAIATLDAPPAIPGALLAGWFLMPAILAASVAAPRLRYGLVVPATLVTGALLAVAVGWLPDEPLGAIGWLLLLAGVGLGGGLGIWLWYRLLPVPAALQEPFGRARWRLIGVHVGLVVVGAILASSPLWLP